MHLQHFLARHPVFTVEEAQRFLNTEGGRSKNTLKALLRYHLNKGRIVRVKRGLYAVVPPDATKANEYLVDSYLIAAKLTHDAVISHHTALAFYGYAHSIAHHFIYSTQREMPVLAFQSCQYQAVLFPKRLQDTHQERFLVKQEKRSGIELFVTSFERTLVDLFNRPDLGFGWEEIWRSLENIHYFDIAKVIEYTLLLNSATTTAKIGFYLEQRREALMVEEQSLCILEKHIPKQPHYMNKDRHQLCRLQKRWNLIVPIKVLDKLWEEPL